LLERLNDANYDSESIDRSLEWSEAIEVVKKLEPGIITSDYSEADYMMAAYRDYLEEQQAVIN